MIYITEPPGTMQATRILRKRPGTNQRRKRAQGSAKNDVAWQSIYCGLCSGSARNQTLLKNFCIVELDVFLLKDTSNQVFFGFPAFDESGTGAHFLGLIGTETPVR